eukprot:1216181-Amphidinium_carterae.2
MQPRGSKGCTATPVRYAQQAKDEEGNGPQLHRVANVVQWNPWTSPGLFELLLGQVLHVNLCLADHIRDASL